MSEVVEPPPGLSIIEEEIDKASTKSGDMEDFWVFFTAMLMMQL